MSLIELVHRIGFIIRKDSVLLNVFESINRECFNVYRNRIPNFDTLKLYTLL